MSQLINFDNNYIISYSLDSQIIIKKTIIVSQSGWSITMIDSKVGVISVIYVPH